MLHDDAAHAGGRCGRCERMERRYERERRARMESEAIAEQFSRRAMQDTLTGLGNRSLFVDQLELSLDRCRRGRRRLGLLFLDLDDFKLVNDTLGHGAGDRLLTEIGARIAASTRPGDVAARLGGDEFVVLCEDGDLEVLRRIAERLSDRILEPVEVDGHTWHTRCSIGIRVADGEDSPGAVLRDADTAMYVAKTGGKGQVSVFTPGTRSRLVERIRLSTDLREAMATNQLEVWFQPLVDLRDATLVGAEALSRWRHPERGMVPPDEFIELAEEIGDVGTIGTRVMEAAARRTVSWRRQPGWATHVNIHPSELDDPLLPDRTARVLAMSGVAGESLCLEITEQTLVSQDEVVLHNVKRLRDLGLGLAIDDFGVSYSSFSYLKRLPVTALKIDRSFVAGVGVDRRDDAIVSAVVAMADALDLSMVAEGVETQEQAERLLELGVGVGQGWLYAPAVAPERWTEVTASLRPTPDPRLRTVGGC